MSKVILLRFILFGICFIILGNVMGQDLRQHLWKNRIIVIETSHDSLTLYQRQLSEFKNSTKEFKERKIVLYEIVGSTIKMTDYLSDEHKEQWLEEAPTNKKSKDSRDQFKVLLIGLDGGIKYETNNIFKKSELIRLIDAMLMRISEIRNNH